MERRKLESLRSSPLPADFLKMVTEVFSANFDEALKRLAKIAGNEVAFAATGEVYPSEIVLCVSLLQGAGLSATSVYASSDFDPKASSPTIQDLLGLCVDAIGAVFEPLLDPKKPRALENILGSSLSSLEGAPFEWAPVEVEKRRIHVKIDKANPTLERIAEDWLAKNDPEHAQRELREREETEKLFVTGPDDSRKGKGGGSGEVH